MAQRTGPERLLGHFAKTTSARVTLALVAAALALGGCGGGSDEQSPAAAGASSKATAKSAASGAPAPDGESKASPDQKQGSGAAGGDGATAAADGAGSEGQGQGQSQKRGPRIAQPTGPTEQAPSAEEIANATVADITLQSPAIIAQGGSLGRLAPTYTCDGKDSWPAFQWGGVPPGTAELALFAMNLQPVDEAIFFDWALGAIDPDLSAIEAGELPKGAVVGTNSFGKSGYSLCPPSAAGETYMFALYALPQRLGLKRGFDPKAARKAALAISGNVGLLPAVYERG